MGDLKKDLDKTSEPNKQTNDQQTKTDGINRRNIIIVAGVFVAVLVVLLSILFGIRAYQANRAEKAQLQAEQEAEQRRIREEEERKKEEEDRQAAAELAEWEAQFFFPYSDKQAIEESALSALGDEDLELAKYEILARHGRVFSTQAYTQYFEAKPWYTPDVNFDESTLSEIERVNMALIDQVLAGRRNAWVAQALLDKLEESPYSPYDNDQFGTWENIQRQDGICYWTALGYSGDHPDAVIFYRTSGGNPVSSYSGNTGILTAKNLDMNKDGTPELAVIRLTNDELYDRQAISVEVWESDGNGGVKLLQMDEIDLGPLWAMGEPPSYTLSFVPGAERDYLCARIGLWTKFYSAGLEGPAITFYYNSGMGDFVPEEYYTDPEYKINNQLVSAAEYQQQLDQWTRGEVLWGDNLVGSELPAVFCNGDHPVPAGTCGALYLDLKAELEATRAYLAQMANR